MIVVVRSWSVFPEVLMYCDIRGVTCRTFLRAFMWLSSLGYVVFTGHLCCLLALSCTHPWRLMGGHYGPFTIPESISSRWACMMTWNGPWYCPELRRVKTALISVQTSIKSVASSLRWHWGALKPWFGDSSHHTIPRHRSDLTHSPTLLHTINSFDWFLKRVGNSKWQRLWASVWWEDCYLRNVLGLYLW